MEATDTCLTCYKSSVKVECTGKLIRSRPYGTGNRVTAKDCIAQKGQCCSGLIKPFNPNSTPDESCNNCYSGTPKNTKCSGKLLSSIDFTPKTCVQFGGRCCDGDWQGIRNNFMQLLSAEINTWCEYRIGIYWSFLILRPGTTVGSAYCTSAIFNSALLKNCNLCYSGSPKVAA